jgi:predicted nucleotidyltransferase component of viral defense system
MEKKRLITGNLVRDIQAGLRDIEIRYKYRISQKELKKILKELLIKGEITRSDLERRTDYFFKRIRRLAIIAMFSDDDLMNRLVLKGGNALDIAYSLEFRSSIDLDFSMDGEFSPEEIDDIKSKVQKCLRETLLPEGYEVFDVTFAERPPQVSADMADFWGGYLIEFKIIEKAKHIGLTHELDSLRRQSEAVDPSARKKSRIEISKFEYCRRKQELELDNYTIYVYSPEQIVVEKIRAICQQMPEYGRIVKSRSQSPRPKDFFDIYVTIEHFNVDLTSDSTLDLVRCSFDSKRVPLELIPKIRDYRDYHNQAFDGVKDTVYSGTDLKDFDFYFDYVVGECEKLKPLWEE